MHSTRVTLRSSAQELQQETATEDTSSTLSQECGMNIDIYVQEQISSGLVVPLDFTRHSELDPLKWGFSDSINQLPYSDPAMVIPFTHPTQARYTNFVQELTFVPFPKQSQIYSSEQNVDLTLTYQDSLFDILQREIKRCSVHDDAGWLCKPDNNQNLETFTGIPVKCSMDLSLGWIVAKKGAAPQVRKNINIEFAQTKPAEDFVSTDISGDGQTSVVDMSILISAYGSHDPQSDINKDGYVNGLDYTLLIDALRLKNSN